LSDAEHFQFEMLGSNFQWAQPEPHTLPDIDGITESGTESYAPSVAASDIEERGNLAAEGRVISLDSESWGELEPGSTSTSNDHHVDGGHEDGAQSVTVTESAPSHAFSSQAADMQRMSSDTGGVPEPDTPTPDASNELQAPPLQFKTPVRPVQQRIHTSVSDPFTPLQQNSGASDAFASNNIGKTPMILREPAISLRHEVMPSDTPMALRFSGEDNPVAADEEEPHLTEVIPPPLFVGGTEEPAGPATGTSDLTQSDELTSPSGTSEAERTAILMQDGELADVSAIFDNGNGAISEVVTTNEATETDKKLGADEEEAEIEEDADPATVAAAASITAAAAAAHRRRPEVETPELYVSAAKLVQSSLGNALRPDDIVKLPSVQEPPAPTKVK
jgi:hypothetical protein